MGNTQTCQCGRVDDDNQQLEEVEVVRTKKKKKKQQVGNSGIVKTMLEEEELKQREDTAAAEGRAPPPTKKKKGERKKKPIDPPSQNAAAVVQITPASSAVGSPLLADAQLKPGGAVVDTTVLLPAFKLLNEGQTFTRYLLSPNTQPTKLPDGTYVWPEDQFREEEIFLWWEPDSKLGTLFWCTPPPTLGNRPEKSQFQQMRVHHIRDIVSKLGVLPGGVEPVASFPRRNIQPEACLSIIDRSGAQLRLMAKPRGQLSASDVRMNWFKAVRAARGAGGQPAVITQSPAASSARHRPAVPAGVSPAAITPNNTVVTPAAAAAGASPSLSNTGLAAQAQANSANTSSAAISGTPGSVQRSLVAAASAPASTTTAASPANTPIAAAVAVTTAKVDATTSKKKPNKGKKK